MPRPVRYIILFLLLAIAGLYLREAFFVIRSAAVRAEPAEIYPGDNSVLTVRFLNALGGKVPFAHREVRFEVVQGGEHCTLRDAQNPNAIIIHAISPGDVVIHVHVDGFALPFETTVRIHQPLG